MYLATFDIFIAGADVHGHSHDNLQPGLDCTCPPQWHACVTSELSLLQAVQLLLSIRQALLRKVVTVCIGQIMVWHTGGDSGSEGHRIQKSWLICREGLSSKSGRLHQKFYKLNTKLSLCKSTTETQLFWLLLVLSNIKLSTIWNGVLNLLHVA